MGLSTGRERARRAGWMGILRELMWAAEDRPRMVEPKEGQA